MTKKVISMEVPAGIQRDGTVFDAPCYVDGKWVRFQRGRPRKIGGYNGIFLDATGVSRGMAMTAVNGLNYVVSGYNNGLQQWITDSDDGLGSGPYNYSFSGGVVATSITDGGSLYTVGTYTGVALTGGSGAGALATVVVSTVTVNGVPVNKVTSVVITTAGSAYLVGDVLSASAASIGGTGSGFALSVTGNTTFLSDDNNLWQFDVAYDSTGNNTNNLVAHPGQNLKYITSTTNTPVLYGEFPGNSSALTLTKVGVFTASGTTNGTTTFTLAASSVRVGAGQSITGTGIPDGTTVVSVVGTAVTMSAAATGSAIITATFDNNIAVSGGCVVIHPYLFIYGNNGLIQNSSAGDFANWVAADANANNVATGKIVKGLPIRGGSTSPSGLFWAADALIRVSFQPSSVGGINYYWTYDLVSSQTSIMSSSSVIEYDGIFYWAGVDRFLMYNGVVQEVPNGNNQNYFFDNVNMAQRQKVWATKVPRYGEIWFFYPKGAATECTDAIIYNVRDKTWYDAGEADGARRSAGVFSEVFPKPIWAGIDANSSGKYTLWQHETGVDRTYLTSVNAVQSYFETYSVGTLGGLVGSVQQPGDNLWTRLERIEPDFVQVGDMTVVVTGQGYADDTVVDSDPYVFSPNTLKIDMREQRREMRLRFESNTAGGTYQTGRVLLSLTTGDVRGTGNP